jgi:hypothetical protein
LRTLQFPSCHHKKWNQFHLFVHSKI